MNQERISFSIILRIALSLVPIFFGMPTVAAVLCAYNIAMSLVLIGPVTSIISSLCAVCFSMFFCGFILDGGELDGLYIALEAVLMGFACGIIIIKRESFYKGVWLSSAAYLVVSYTNVMQEAHASGMSVADYLTAASFHQMKSQLSQIISQAGLDETTILSILETVKKATVTIIPSVLIIASVVIGYAVVWFVKNSLNKLPLKEKTSHSFSTIRMPKLTVIVMILSLVLSFAVKSENVGFVLINVFTVLAALGFFAGMSVVDFYLRKRIQSLPARICVHMLIYFSSAFITGIIPLANIFLVYALVGAIDSFVNIRRIPRNEAKKEEVYEEE